MRSSNPSNNFIEGSHPAFNKLLKKTALLAAFFNNLAEREGFEPSIRCRIHAFQACAFNHSAISPAPPKGRARVNQGLKHGKLRAGVQQNTEGGLRTKQNECNKFERVSNRTPKVVLGPRACHHRTLTTSLLPQTLQTTFQHYHIESTLVHQKCGGIAAHAGLATENVALPLV